MFLLISCGLLLGQDPYHGSGQAQGLSFSVPQTFKIPPSLRTIYKELDQSVSTFEVPLHGDLTHWAQQGVLLLNAILTVFESEPASHRKVGWQGFTDQLIQELSDRMDGLVFLLWGNFAKKKATLIDGNKHLILEAAHPSPLARGAFLVQIISIKQINISYLEAKSQLGGNGKITDNFIGNMCF